MKSSNTLKGKLKTELKKRGFYMELVAERDELKKTVNDLEKTIENNQDLLDYHWFAKPGHYYSPLIEDQKFEYSHPVDESKLSELAKKPIPGINLNTEAQLEMLQKLAKYYGEKPDYDKPSMAYRYQTDNDQFGISDACFLFLMLRHLKPANIIEIGSGWSSAVMLDTLEQYAQKGTKLTFIEPYPERLYTALNAADKKKTTIIDKPAQSVPLKYFEQVKAGDLLFIDSSHVSKSGSDVNYLYFDVLPRLQKGTIVHVHDIYFPFEYPNQWVVHEKRNWNEVYTLRALLMGSNLFEIMFWPNFLFAYDEPVVKKLIPVARDNAGASIWLKKIA